MGEGHYMTKTLVKDLAAMTGAERVLSDRETITQYSHDTSLAHARKPAVVVRVKSTAEVQQVVKYANEHSIPVTPRSSGVGFYGAGIPEQGGIIIDMTRMKRIMKVDTRNKWALMEPGVTYGELQQELARARHAGAQPAAAPQGQVSHNQHP